MATTGQDQTVVADEKSLLFNQAVDVLKQMVPLLPTYGHLIVSAVFPIYTASHASLVRPSSAAPAARTKRKKAKTDDDDDEEEEEEEEEEEGKSVIIENLTPTDALLLPLLAGITLASLYFILKWLEDPQLLNKILSIYFSWVGIFFMYKFFCDALTTIRSFVFPGIYSSSSRRSPSGSVVHIWTVDLAKRVYTTTTTEEKKTNTITAVSGSEVKVKPTLSETHSPLPGFLRRIPLGKRLSSGIWQIRNVISTPATLHLHIKGVLTADTRITIIDPVALILSLILVGIHAFIAKPWFLTNLLGFSFCYAALQFTTPTTALTGSLVLGALFLYDIYFVFYTPMMVTVATKLDVPIKLLFPQPHGCALPPEGSPSDSAAVQAYRDCVAKSRAMAMLGLGDIVVPGMMIAFALRFDLFLHYSRLARTLNSARTTSTTSTTTSSGGGAAEKEEQKPEYKSATGGWGERFWTNKTVWSQSGPLQGKSFSKHYFHATLVGYVAGLVVTLVALQVMRHGQPALLYLVPGVLGMFWGTALVRGELKALWGYNEGGDEEEQEEAEGKEKKGKEKETESNDGDNAKKEEEGKGGRKRDRNSRKLVDFSITLLQRARTGTGTDKIKNPESSSSSSPSSSEGKRIEAEGQDQGQDQNGTLTKRRKLAQ